ncbi:M1 family metallopeptidase [uncultured Serinicoccus sp.]|uniref:M1 family metallopeptidase n=1 Tax=uncultured Serinicoccus sp. TaxID=735514 RepID=UPI00260A599A|nr:M1 family metallopeptidase [uncultured Serinicoccus sp.]
MHRRSTRRIVPATLALGALVAAPVAAGAAPDRPGEPRYVEGAAGAGDPYLPLAGNGGIDVEHYDLDLRYSPPPPDGPLEGRLDGVTTITLTATQDLRAFHLDLRGLQASAVTVDGKRARFEAEQGNELVITPRPKLKAGDTVEVVVSYGGTTGRPTDLEGALYGWVTTRDGAMVVSQPDGSATWFPVSDHPTDKASYTFEVTVPDGLVAVANGLLEGSETEDGWTTWSWDAPDPMAAYLATATVGDFELSTSTTPSGVPVIDAVDPDLPDSASANLALTGEMMTFFEGLFGDYPFVAYGAIVDDDSVGYALETQTRSFFSRRANEGTVAHELVHQWIGDDVAVHRWADIWHNEGWATYGSWLWTQEQGGATAQARYESVMAIPADDGFWALEIGDPGPLNLFHPAIYSRSAAMLHALRAEIGEDAFWELTRTVVEDYAGSDLSTQEYRGLAAEISGQDLDTFFEVWLDTPEKPTDW